MVFNVLSAPIICKTSSLLSVSDNGWGYFWGRRLEDLWLGCRPNVLDSFPCWSPQFSSQILRLEMVVPAQHAQVFMPGYASDVHNVEALLDQPGSGFVAQVQNLTGIVYL